MAAMAAADMPSYDSSDPGKQRNSNSDDSFDSTMKFCTRCRTNRPISIFRGKRKKMVKDCATYLQTTTTAGGVASGAVSAAPGPATPNPATVASIEPTWLF